MQKKTAIISISLLSAAVLLLGCLSLWLYVAYESPEEIAAKEQARLLSKDLASVRQELSDEVAEKNAKIAELQALSEELAEKQQAIAALEYEVGVLLDEERAADEYQRILLNRISLLKEEAEVTAARILELTELIDNYENITTLNFGYQAQKISDLWIKLTEPNRPMRILTEDVIDEETGEVIETLTEEVPAHLSFFYKDLATGYTLSYNSEEVMYSASIVKAPYIYALLKSVAAFEESKLLFDSEGNALYDEEGEPLFIGRHPNLDEDGRILYGEGEEKYDLSRVWTFNKKEMTEEGSGYIKNMEDGVQFTYLELVEYALLYSDNVAFAQLRKMFGYTEYYTVASALGVNGYGNGFMRLSAEDCGRFLEAINAFCEENEAYGPLMKEAMLHSNHIVVIPFGVSPTPAAHKYGWDLGAYHDMAIVYDEHPYIFVLMSDLDQGGGTVNAYLQDIVRSVHSIHKNFYAEN